MHAGAAFQRAHSLGAQQDSLVRLERGGGQTPAVLRGDTGYHPEFANIGKRFGPFDVALVPIGAYDPRWFMQPVHMNPEEAVQALQDVARGANDGRPTRMVPMHWGTFKLTDEPLDEPPERAQRAWEQAGLAAEHCCVLAHGETLLL